MTAEKKLSEQFALLAQQETLADIATGLLVEGIVLSANGDVVSDTNPLPVAIRAGIDQPLTNDQLRASAVPMSSLDGGITTIGAKADAAATDSTSSWSLVSLVKGAFGVAQAMQVWWSNRLGTKTAANSLSVTPASDAVIKIDGGNTNAVKVDNSAVTQPVSGTITANIGTTNGLALDTTINGLLKPSSTLSALGGINSTVVVKADATGNQTSPFIVAGQAAVGSAPTVNPVGVSGVDGSGLKRSLLTDSGGRLVVGTNATLTATGTLGALNATVSIDITSPYRTVEFFFKNGNLSGITGLYAGFDDGAGGTTWQQLSAKRIDGGASSFTTYTTTGSGHLFRVWRASIPAGAIKVAAYCLGYTSGASDVVVCASDAVSQTVVTADVSLSASTARIGSIFAGGVAYSDTTTALSANGTFTSTARDVTATTAGSTFASATTYAKEYRVLAVQDVAFTLYLEVSQDGSTFRRIKQVAAAQNVTGGLYIAELNESPKWKFYRYAIINGASSAAHTTGGSMLLSA